MHVRDPTRKEKKGECLMQPTCSSISWKNGWAKEWLAPIWEHDFFSFQR